MPHIWYFCESPFHLRITIGAPTEEIDSIGRNASFSVRLCSSSVWPFSFSHTGPASKATLSQQHHPRKREPNVCAIFRGRILNWFDPFLTGCIELPDWPDSSRTQVVSIYYTYWIDRTNDYFQNFHFHFSPYDAHTMSSKAARGYGIFASSVLWT